MRGEFNISPFLVKFNLIPQRGGTKYVTPIRSVGFQRGMGLTDLWESFSGWFGSGRLLYSVLKVSVPVTTVTEGGKGKFIDNNELWGNWGRGLHN